MLYACQNFFNFVARFAAKQVHDHTISVDFCFFFVLHHCFVAVLVAWHIRLSYSISIVHNSSFEYDNIILFSLNFPTISHGFGVILALTLSLVSLHSNFSVSIARVLLALIVHLFALSVKIYVKLVVSMDSMYFATQRVNGMVWGLSRLSLVYATLYM